jgi:WD40 repeat protein/transcriptional regulator with XRE-family HTH domain
VPHQPISPDSFQSFGDVLKYLRRREHLTQLELSIMVGYSDAQITRLEKNQRRPDLAALKALFVPALHLEDEPELLARFLELAQTAQQEDAPVPGIPPYKGLLFFDVPDAELFFGRETLTAYLVDRLSNLAIDSSSRFLAVVGASGSGKSSLVRAGLAVVLRRAGWNVRIFTPGANPLKALEMQLELDQVKAGSAQLLILVDQFEETFTLCHDESERVSFIDKLLSLAQEPSKKKAVVIALRADFYSHCAQYPLLRQAVAAEQEYIGQMTAEELRRAIEEPARRGGWEFEPGLVDVLLQDIGAHGSHEPEPGALPLLSHALLATWERRRGRTFTLDGYHASGGVRGAIAETAESVFTDQLNQTQQELARDVFLRLTELGEGTEDTRRRAALNELVRQSAEATQLRAVLNMLAEARLITLNEDSAEVAHEALIREWQRLHEWLTQDRVGLLLHRHLTESTHEWEIREHDPVELYRGARLAQAREWASINEERLNVAERAFLTASIEQEEHDALDREAQRQRELEAAQKLAETEHHNAKQLRRRAVYLVGVLALAIIAALTAGVFANRNATLAGQNASIAQTAQVANTQALTDFTRSESQRLAAEANSLMLNNGDTNLIALLAIRSLNMQYTPSGDAVLAGLTTLESPPLAFKGHTGDVWGVDFSPDGKYLVTGSSDRTARLWDVATGETIRIFSGHTGEIDGVEFSPDGKYLLTGGGANHTALLWNVANGETVQIFSGHTGNVDDGAFSPDGKLIVTAGGEDKTARIWDVATGKTLYVLTGHTDYVPRVAFSPEGKYVLTTGDQTARLWDVATGEQVQIFPGADYKGFSALAFSSDGKYIATGSDDHIARLWEIAGGTLVREFIGHQGFVNGIAFSPDGRFLLTSSHDRTTRLWDVATGETLRVFSGHTGQVQGVAFSPEGNLIATGSNDGIARVWNLQRSPTGIQFIGHKGTAWQASFSPDSKQVVTASGDGTARIWNVATGQTMNTIIGHTNEIRGAVFSPDGKMVLTASADHTARLWDAMTGKELRRFEGHTDVVGKAVFSPDGKYVVTTSFDGTARVWDAQTGQTIVIYRNQSPEHVNRVAFSHDGKLVATSGDDDTARIWDSLTGKDRIVIQQTDIVTGLAFSPDGKYLVTCSFDGSVRLWDVTSGTEVRRFAGHTVAAFGAAFSSDGKYILTSGRDGTARLWDVQTGQEVRRFTGHTAEVRDVAFSPDGKYILTASFDGTARLWLADLNETIRAVCGLLTRDLTPEERVQFGIADQGPTCPAQ